MDARPASAHGPGTLIDDRYRLVRPIAEGGMGVVWEAQHLALGKPVALKLLHADVAELPGVGARFEREARATSRLDHPSIVRVLDFGCSRDGALFLVLELLAGRSLGKILEDGPLEPVRAVALIDQVLDGLALAHDQGLVHRDLKPDNVFVCRGSDGKEQAKILDFGIAALRGPQQRTQLTQAGAVMGTPAYMSPEQAMGRPDLDGRSDLHAVGVVLYELLAGSPPYSGDNYHQILHAILTGAPTPLSERRPGLPQHLYTVVARAMAREPEARFPDAKSFREALRGAVETPAFRMPAQLATTDLGRDEVAPSVRIQPVETRTPEALAPVSEPLITLEIDRPAPAAAEPAPPPRRGAMWLGIGLGLAGALGAAVFAGTRPRPPANATIDLAAVPPGARLSLDGIPVSGDRLVLPRSTRERVLTIASPHHPSRQLRFVADRDQTLSLVEQGTPR